MQKVCVRENVCAVRTKTGNTKLTLGGWCQGLIEEMMTKPGKGLKVLQTRDQHQEGSTCGMFGGWSLQQVHIEVGEGVMSDFFGRWAGIGSGGA